MTEDSTTPLSRRLREAIASKMTKKNLAFSASAAALFLASFLIFKTGLNPSAGLLFADPAFGAPVAMPTNVKWGFAVDNFNLFEDQFKQGDILGKILTEHGLSAVQIDRMVKNSAGIFQISRLQTGKKFTILSSNPDQPEWMIYEPSPYEFVTFQLKEPFKVEMHKRAVVTELKSSSGVLETNFWQAMTDNGLSDEVADKMIDILASSVDFYHQKEGDRFKVVYEQHIVEGKPVGTGKVVAAQYEREGKISYSFRFDDPTTGKTDYFDADGRPARKAFLRTPIRFSRISSGFSMNRHHPILGYNRPHFGTDYAAPHGTPIQSVADGVVVEATRRGGNGNFVKIRHDKTYETQYLHMSKFAAGIRPGTRVMQGQTIGYVGSTGLATGPHCCFRFWKNGQQVNWLKLNLPNTGDPMKGKSLEAFQPVKAELIAKLDAVQYRTQAEIFQANSTEKAKP